MSETDSSDRLIVAITSRALFDMADSHALFEEAGLEAFHAYQRQRENDPIAPGIAFPLVQKLLRLNPPKPAPATGTMQSQSFAASFPPLGRG